MQLHCPDCGTPIPSENINIQRMAAVCPACHTVFQFDPADTRIKRRKVKKPSQITLNETGDHVNIAFRTNFRLDRNEEFLASAGLSILFTFITTILIRGAFTKPEAALVAVGFGLVTVFLYYCLALLAYNKTYIEISDQAIKVSRKPLPNLLTQPTVIGFSGITHIRYEETAESKKRGFDMPRYNVWAEMVEGRHKLVVGNVIEDYAVFISQQLNELLGLGAPSDGSRLLGDEAEVENGQILEDPLTSEVNARQV